jgi:hypothetical protein
LFACNLILEITGVDLMHFFRGRYTTKEYAYVLLLKRAGRKKQIDGALLKVTQKETEEANFTAVPVTHLQSGDLVCADTDQGEALGIYYSNKVWIKSETGVVALPTDCVLGAWRAP